MVRAPPTAYLLGQTNDAPQAPHARRPTAAHVLAPTEALPQVDIDIDTSTDDPSPPQPLADIVPSARFTAPTPNPEPDADPTFPPRSSRREQTGETGIYTERLRRDAFELSVDVDPDDLPDLEQNAESGWQYVTGRHPPSLRRFLLFRALPAGLLIAITVWSWLLIRSGDRTAPRAGEDVEATTDEQPEPTPSETPPVVTPPPPPEPEDPETRATLKLLDSYAEHVSASGTVGRVQLKQAVTPRKVTVVNLWATWCQPCLLELPFLQETFRVQNWKDVAFVPLQVFDPKPVRNALRDHAADMPPFDHFLADRDLSSGPKAALISEKRLPEKFDLPVTILFDCNRKIHKIYREAFNTPEKFGEFIQDVDKLRGKLDSPACRPKPDTQPSPPASQFLAPTATPSAPPPPPLPPPPPPKPKRGCGDGFCDRKQETCECAKDCPCSPSEYCKFRADSGSACVTRTKIGP